MVDTVEIVAPSLAPTKNSGPKIRMAVVSGECTSSPKKSKIMKVEPAVHSTEYQTDKNEKNSQYFYENGRCLFSVCLEYILPTFRCVVVGKRMRMVERIRTDGRTGKQIKVVIKEEVPSDWESEEDG